MRRIVVVGGGYAGFYAAWKLEKKLRRGEAEVVVIDPRPYMTYQPFLPEVLSGSVEARHAAISLRRNLHHTKLIAGSVTRVEHARRTVTIQPVKGPEYELEYDVIAVTAGAVTRTFDLPGVADRAIGMKHVEEAVAIRDRLLTAFDEASVLPPGPERRRLLTVTFVGGGFAGVEGFGELLSLANALLKKYRELTRDDLAFHLVEATQRILPEVTDGPRKWVRSLLERRGAHLHLDTTLVSAEDGHVILSDGTEYDTELLVWTAGNAATRLVRGHTDLPVTDRGLIQTRADLRVGTETEVIPDAWAAGDDAAVPDLASPVPGAFTVPNAQNAVRQGKRLAKNLLASLRGREPKKYIHHTLGAVATLGLGTGIFQFRWIVVRGFLAWLMHRGYHVLAVPTWDRKMRVLSVWLAAAIHGRDIVSLASVQRPRDAFVNEASLPKLSLADVHSGGTPAVAEPADRSS
ncbi:FAD-dependent oxidoreductase [Kribbella sp. NPDC050281]|uniref:NAD(P)/FAD-dependent oxidoreductase n=1 Tax=Kribbella sp. NPDC050281 TaxID=3155515 RepID=UPI0033CE97A8